MATTKHEAVNLDGSRIDWNHPPKANTIVKWTKKTTGGKTIKGSLRTIAHLNRLNNLALGKFGTGIAVLQGPFNTTVSASAGTHDYDACVDLYIPGVDWYKAQAFLRANGFGCWVRKPPSFGWHIHGFTLPPREGKDPNDDFKIAGFKVGKYVDGGLSTAGAKITSSQIEDYYSGRSGLAGHAADNSWRPENQPIFNLRAYIERRQS